MKFQFYCGLPAIAINLTEGDLRNVFMKII